MLPEVREALVNEVLEALLSLSRGYDTRKHNHSLIPVTHDFNSVGTLDDKWQRLLVYKCHLLDAAEEINTAGLEEVSKRRGGIMTKTECEIIPVMNALLASSNVIDSVFWYNVRRQYPNLSDKLRLSVRAGWLVGWEDESER